MRKWIQECSAAVVLVASCSLPGLAQDWESLQDLAGKAVASMKEVVPEEYAMMAIWKIGDRTGKCDVEFFQDQLELVIVNSGTFNLINTQRLDEILKEIEFTHSGLVDPAKMKKVGELKGVRAFLYGKIVDVGEVAAADGTSVPHTTAVLKLVSTKTTHLVWAGKITGFGGSKAGDRSPELKGPPATKYDEFGADLAGLLDAALEGSERRTVFDFSRLDRQPEQLFDPESFLDALAVAIARSKHCAIVDRKTLEVLFEEQKLVLDGIVTQEERDRLAKVWAVDAFLDGKIWRCEDRLLEGTMEATEIDTRVMLFKKRVTGRGGEVETAPARVEPGQPAAPGTRFEARLSEIEATAKDLEECRKTMTEANPRVIELRKKLEELPGKLAKDIQARIAELRAQDADLAKLYKPADSRRQAVADEILRLEETLRHPLVVFAKLLPTMDTEVGGGVRMRLVLVPPGKFLMGSPATEANRDNDEGPQHEVTISRPFYMGAFEVTQQEYQAVVGTNPSGGFKGARKPVANVSWNDADAFCNKLSQRTGLEVRLPTEAEWEYACRAGTSGPYAGALDAMAWYSGNSDWRAHPVGEKKPNGFALHDMHGNVWEWCQDWYGPYSGGAQVNPKGPASGSGRVLRGGSWSFDPRYCRSAFRSGLVPEYRYGDGGFRVVVSPGRVDTR